MAPRDPAWSQNSGGSAALGACSVGVPDGPPPADLGAWLEGRGVDAAVVDWEMAARPFLSGHFEAVEGHGLRATVRIPGWDVVYTDRDHRPPHVMLLEKAAPTRAGRRP